MLPNLKLISSPSLWNPNQLIPVHEKSLDGASLENNSHHDCKRDQKSLLEHHIRCHYLNIRLRRFILVPAIFVFVALGSLFAWSRCVNHKPAWEFDSDLMGRSLDDNSTSILTRRDLKNGQSVGSTIVHDLLNSNLIMIISAISIVPHWIWVFIVLVVIALVTILSLNGCFGLKDKLGQISVENNYYYPFRSFYI